MYLKWSIRCLNTVYLTYILSHLIWGLFLLSYFVLYNTSHSWERKKNELSGLDKLYYVQKWNAS